MDELKPEFRFINAVIVQSGILHDITTLMSVGVCLTALLTIASPLICFDVLVNEHNIQ